jgi:UDP-N-acetylmuramate dehydrogenase
LVFQLFYLRLNPMIESKIRSNVILAPMTTFRIGGPARYFVIIENKEELIEAFAWSKKNNIKNLLIGGGSNVLINDRGIDALVIKIQNKNMALKGERIEAAAGEDLNKLVLFATANSMSGFEWAAGIPGTVGGAIRGNAGAFGHSISGNIELVEVLNLLTMNFENYSQRECWFEYRHSIFSNKNLLIWSGLFKLKYGDPVLIKKEIEQNLKHRNVKQPKLPSAGSIFKNIDIEILKSNNIGLYEKAAREGMIKGNKLAAGWIIDQLELKGKKIGGAKVSLEHGNFIINTGNATSEDVIILISFIKQQVRTKLNIQLTEEIEYFGF